MTGGNRAYMIVFNEELGTRKQVQDFLDALPEVIYWYGCLPNCIFFTSFIDVEAIYKKVTLRFGLDGGKRFLVVGVNDERQGWLPKAAWRIFSNPDRPIMK